MPLHFPFGSGEYPDKILAFGLFGYLGLRLMMSLVHMHVKVRLSVKRLATKSTSPKVDTIMKLGQFLYLEHISVEMEGTI